MYLLYIPLLVTLLPYIGLNIYITLEIQLPIGLNILSSYQDDILNLSLIVTSYHLIIYPY